MDRELRFAGKREVAPGVWEFMFHASQPVEYIAGQYAKLPMVSGLKNNMNDYVTAKAMDGIFYYVAQEEAAIRQNPAKRTTDLLKTVFGTR